MHTAHGIETRYIAKEARGTLASVDVPRVSTGTRKGSHVALMNGVTTEDRPPEVDSSSFSNASLIIPGDEPEIADCDKTHSAGASCLRSSSTRARR